MNQEDEYRIRLRAYELWHEAGRPHGRHLEYWVAAEKEFLAKRRELLEEELDEGLIESFPASDAPSVLRRNGTS